MKKHLSFLISILFLSLGCFAQTTAVTALVTDSDGTNWFGGTWKITFVPNPANPNVALYNINGIPLSNSVLYQNGVMDSGGNLGFSIYQSTAISPANSSWQLTVCPQAVTQCGVYNFSTSSASLDLSSVLTTTIPPPRFHGIANTYGYTDPEAVLQLVAGNTYYNVTMLCQRIYNGTSWSCLSTGGGTSCNITGTANYFVFWDGTSCITKTIDEGALNADTTTTTDQNVTINATGAGGSTVDILSSGEDGIQECTEAGGGVNCPPSGNNGPINLQAGGAVDISSALASINITAEIGALNLSSIAGNWDDTSTQGIVLAESGSSGTVELDNSGTGNIQFNSAGGIQLDDNNLAGIQINENATNAPIAVGADEIDLFAGVTGTNAYGPFNLHSVTGVTQCLHADPTGLVSGTGADCGSGSGINGHVYTTSWTLVAGEAATANCASACIATLPASISTGFSGTIVSVGAGNVTIASGGPTYDGVTVIPTGTNLGVWTDGTNYHSSRPAFVYINQSLCTPAASTDSSCTGTYSLPAAYANSTYAVNIQMQSSVGAFLFAVVSSKSSTSFDYAVTCTFNCSSIGTVTADIQTKHN